MSDQPQVLSANQIEAHITRLTSVSVGLDKYADVDYRALEAVAIIAVVISTLNQVTPIEHDIEVEAARQATETADAETEVLKAEAEEAVAIEEAARVNDEANEATAREREDAKKRIPATDVETPGTFGQQN